MKSHIYVANRNVSLRLLTTAPRNNKLMNYKNKLVCVGDRDGKIE